MSALRVWRPLPLPQQQTLPVLLVSFCAGASDYTVRISDMANIWIEALDRKEIFIRGWKENPVIDPSDSPENLATLITSIQSALDSSHSEHDQTSLSLFPATAEDAGDDGLTLKLTCKLPGLQPLKWPIHLKKCPPSTVAADLVAPLIQAHYSKTRQIESLISIVKHKDSVLAKLLDKLEATGTGLENVFTALSGKKKVSKAMAETKVKGLSAFDENSWKSELDTEDDGPNNANALVKAVFGTDGLQYTPTMEFEPSPTLDTWWTDFKGVSQTSNASRQRATAASQKTPPPLTPAGSGGEDDDFQKQSTPPHLRSAGKDDSHKHSAPLNGQSPKESEAEELALRKQPATRLGVIGGKSSVLRGTQNVSGEESETASEASDDDETVLNSKELEKATAPNTTSKASAKIGVIGRIGKTTSGSRSSEQGTDDAADEIAEKGVTNATPTHKRLGVIGKGPEKDAISAARSDDSGTSRGRQVTRQSETKEEPRETSQERADRKREELKRELERKAAAGPAKKKRRF